MEQPENDPQSVPTPYLSPLVLGILAYLFFTWPVAALLNRPKNDFAAFHIRQSLGIFLGVILIWQLSIIPYVGWLIWIIGILLFYIYWTVGFMSAVQEKKVLAPYLGQLFQWLFGRIGL